MEKDQNNVLDYTIVDKHLFGKDIDNIKQKNPVKKWVHLLPTDAIEFSVKFTKNSFLTRVEAKGHEGESMELTFRDADGDEIDSLKIIDLKNNYVKNLQATGIAATVDIVLKSSDGQKKTLGLIYLIFKGSSNISNPSKNKPTNLTTQQTIKLDRVDPPNKSKPVGTSQPYRYIPTNIYNKTKFFTERQKKIIKPKEQKKVQDKRNQDVNIDDFFKDDQDTVLIPPPERDYHVTTLESIMPCMEHMNEEWIQRQRKLEEELGIPEEQRLSNYVRALQLARD